MNQYARNAKLKIIVHARLVKQISLPRNTILFGIGRIEGIRRIVVIVVKCYLVKEQL
jgi:hypothetical protein